MSVKWYGKEAIRKLEIANQAGLTAAAILVQGQAKLLCPVDTGRLRNSIVYQVSKDDATIGTDVEYAAYVEFGTRGRKPKSYLRLAIDKNKQEIKDVFRKEYRKRI